ncbi:MAG TPA: hypothetical protein VMW50_07420, partial [Dehalococcoidia bacterium]|nr:hypothetical protein [Dehalococcoidia bacterium]
SESNISYQIRSGGIWAQEYAELARRASQADREAKVREDAEDWVKWEVSQEGGNWAKDYDPDKKQAMIEAKTQELLAERYPEEYGPPQPVEQEEIKYDRPPATGWSTLWDKPRTPIQPIPGLTDYEYQPSSMTESMERIGAIPSKPESFTIYPWNVGIGGSGGESHTYQYNIESEERTQQIIQELEQADISRGDEPTPRYYKYNPETKVATIITPSQAALDTGIGLTFGFSPTGDVDVYASGEKIGGVNLETNEFDDKTIEYLRSYFIKKAYEANPQYAAGYGELDVPVYGAIMNFLTRRRIDSKTGEVAPAIVEILGVIGLVGTFAYMLQAGVTALAQIFQRPLASLFNRLPSSLTGLPKPGKIVVPGDKGNLQTVLFDPKTNQPIPIYQAPKPRYLTISELKLWRAYQQTSGYQEIYNAFQAGRLGEVGGKQALGSFNAITQELGKAYLYEQQAIRIGEQIKNAELALQHLQETGQTQMALRKAQDLTALRQLLLEAQTSSSNIHRGLQTVLDWRLRGEHPDINRIAGLLTSGTPTQVPPATTPPPVTPPTQAGGPIAVPSSGVPPTIPPSATAATGVAATQVPAQVTTSTQSLVKKWLEGGWLVSRPKTVIQIRQLEAMGFEKSTSLQGYYVKRPEVTPAVEPTAPEVAPVTPEVPTAPIVGEQAGMMGVPQKVVSQKSIGKPVTASMEDYAKLQQLRGVAGELSRDDATQVLEGLDLKYEQVSNRIDEGRATLEALQAELSPRIVKMIEIIPTAKMAEGELAYITKGRYKKYWGREPKKEILTPDGKRVRWEYALDEIAQELKLEPIARAAGVNPDEYLKNLIERAQDMKAIMAETRADIAILEGTLGELDAIKQKVNGSTGDTTTGPLFEIANRVLQETGTSTEWGTTTLGERGIYPTETVATTEGLPAFTSPSTLDQKQGMIEIAKGRLLITKDGQLTPEFKKLAKTTVGKGNIDEMTAGEVSLLNDVIIRLPAAKYGRPPRIPSAERILNEILPLSENFIDKIPTLQDIGLLEGLRPARAVWEKIGLYHEIYEPTIFTEVLMNEARTAFAKGLKEIEKLVPRDRRAIVFQAIENPAKKVDLTANEQRAVTWFKQYFDDWADKLELPSIRRRGNYITHIFEADMTQQLKEKHPLDLELVRAFNFISPKTVFMPYLQERLGRTAGLVEDPFRAAEAYQARALKKYYYEPLIKRIRIYERYLEPRAVKALREYTTRLTGRPTETDQALNQNLRELTKHIRKLPGGKKVADLLFPSGNTAGIMAYRMTGWYYTAWLGARPASALKNLSQHGLTLAEVGPEYLAKGIGLRFTEEGKNALRESTVLRSRKIGYLPGVDKAFVSHYAQSIQDKALFLFRQADRQNVSDAFLAGYAEAKANGLPRSWAIKRGDEVAERTQYVYTKMGGAMWTQTAPGRVLGVLTTWPTNFVELATRWFKGTPPRVYTDYAKATGKEPPKAKPVFNPQVLTFLALTGALYAVQRKTRVRAMLYSGAMSLQSLADIMSGNLPGLTWPGGIANIVAGAATGDMATIRKGWYAINPARTIAIVKQLMDIAEGERDWLSLFVYQNQDYVTEKRKELQRGKDRELAEKTVRNVIAQAHFDKNWNELTDEQKQELINLYPDAISGS